MIFQIKLNPCSSSEIKVSSIFLAVFIRYKVNYAIQWRFFIVSYLSPIL